MIVPAGRPIWSRTASVQSYGGHPNKRDYGDIGVVNARTDISAAQMCRLTEDAASLAMVAPLFTMRITAIAGTPISFVVQWVRTLWGKNTNSSYAGASAPTGFPGATNVPSSGDVLHVILPAAATDAFGVEEPIALRTVLGNGSVTLVSFTGSEAVFTWASGIAGSATIRGY